MLEVGLWLVAAVGAWKVLGFLFDLLLTLAVGFFSVLDSWAGKKADERLHAKIERLEEEIRIRNREDMDARLFG